MPDMLVKLYTLPSPVPYLEQLERKGISIRRALVPEKHIVANWVERTFPEKSWRSECEAAFSRLPVSCFLALRELTIVGFYCYDVTCKNFAGPAGVAEEERRKGVYKALTLMALQAMAAEGYAYAILGGMNPVAMAASKTFLGAEVIPDSKPGIYKGMMRSG